VDPSEAALPYEAGARGNDPQGSPSNIADAGTSVYDSMTKPPPRDAGLGVVDSARETPGPDAAAPVDAAAQPIEDATADSSPGDAASGDAATQPIEDASTDSRPDDAGPEPDAQWIDAGDPCFVRLVPSPSTGSHPSSIAVGDLNGDGHPDLAVANAYSDIFSSTVSILLGNGDGTFRPQTEYAVGDYPFAVAMGDLNGDGRLDLAVANESSNNTLANGVSVLLGNGDGTFRQQVQYPAYAPSALVLADLNRDGKLDIALADPANTIFVLLRGNGDGTFQYPTGYSTTATFPGTIAVGDFNGDGLPDLVLGDHGPEPPPIVSTLDVFVGNGDGTFQPPSSYRVGEAVNFVAATDVNGDGKLDLLAANGASNDVSVLLGNGDGSFQAPVAYAAGSAPSAISVADMDGDGRPDLIVSDQLSNEVSILSGDGDGTFGAAVTLSTGASPLALAVSDFNGDGRFDIISADFDSDDLTIILGICPR
jgi:FG-GAP-like repeat